MGERLSALSPRWIGLSNYYGAAPLHIGVSFDCPHCHKQRLAVVFDPPIDPEGIMARFEKSGTKDVVAPGTHVWSRSGDDTFDGLSLSPSIDTGFSGHWHGYIENGEVK